MEVVDALSTTSPTPKLLLLVRIDTYGPRIAWPGWLRHHSVNLFLANDGRKRPRHRLCGSQSLGGFADFIIKMKDCRSPHGRRKEKEEKLCLRFRNPAGPHKIFRCRTVILAPELDHTCEIEPLQDERPFAVLSRCHICSKRCTSNCGKEQLGCTKVWRHECRKIRP
jgi:hypothetical protein